MTSTGMSSAATLGSAGRSSGLAHELAKQVQSEDKFLSCHMLITFLNPEILNT